MASTTFLQKAYLAYFGRPADASGLITFANVSEAQVIASFSASAESQEFFGSMPLLDQINTIYNNLFNRDAEPAGLLHWATKIENGELSLAAAAMEILKNAQNSDVTAVANKVAASAAFTAAVDTTAEILGYAGAASIAPARAFLAAVSSDAATLTAALAGTDAAVTTVVAAGSGAANVGQTFMLTDGSDTIKIDDLYSIDLVKGVFDFDVTSIGYQYSGYNIGGVDNSTFNLGDVIEGNGNTKVEVLMDVTPTFLGEDVDGFFFGNSSIEAEYVEMSGVDELALKAGTYGGYAYFDASSYGDDISKISLAGRDGMYANVYNLQADSTLDVSLQTGGELDVSGEWSDVDFSISLNNSDDSSNSSVGLSAALVSVVAGSDAYVYASLTQSASGDAAVESVGGMVLGDVSLSVAESGEADLDIIANADNTGSGDAVVGDVTIGNMSLTLGKSATDTDITVSMSADATDGAATVGKLTVGDITVTGAAGAAFSQMNFYQYAAADSANATVGSREVGDISITLVGDNSGDYNELSFSQWADADTKGNATIGSTTIGNITVDGGDSIEDQDVFVYSWAYADKGNATVGDTVIGDVEMNFGKGNGDYNWFTFSAEATAQVDTAGVASIGDITVGNITQTVGDGATAGSQNDNLWAYVWRQADSYKGNASVGDILIGDVSQVGGNDVRVSFEASQSAYANDGDATVGNLTVGDITSTVGDRAEANAWIYQWGGVDGGDLVMGDLTVGDVEMKAQVDGSVYFSVEQTGYADSADDTVTIGKTTVGNVDLYAGANGDAGFGLYVTAYNYSNGDKENTSVGDVTIGNVSLKVENSAYVDFWNTISAGSVGNVTYGDISLNVGEYGSVDYFYIDVSASTGDVGNFTVGDLTVDLAVSASLTYDSAGYYVYADESIGDVTIGKQIVNVATSADFGDNYSWENHSTADNGGIGDIVMGDIVFSGKGEDADIDLDTYVTVDDNIKSVTMGSVSATADGYDSDLSIETYLSASDEIGDVSVGDQTAVALGEYADADTYFEISAGDDIADVEFGDVVVRAEQDHLADSNYESSASVEASVDISISGDENLGNVTVGSLSMAAVGDDARADFSLNIGYFESLEDIGDVKIGDLTLMASGEHADVNVDIYVDTYTGVVGTVELGNIDITVANNEDAGAYNELDFVDNPNYQGAEDWDDTDGIWNSGEATVSIDVDSYGDLTVGDINLVQGSMEGWGANYTSGYWDDQYVWRDNGDGGYWDLIGYEWEVETSTNLADMYAYVSLSSWYGDLVIGDITVTGGYKTAAGDVNDNYSSLEDWMELYADGTITVGDIDYSGYERDAYIDVESYLGAANVMAAQDDTYIVDNKTKNVITLGTGYDEVQLVNENTGKATAAVVDEIIGFNTAKDTIVLEFGWDEFSVNTTDAVTYAQFLLDAETANEDIYAGKVGNDYYVAFDKDNGEAVDFVVKLTGVSSIDESIFDYYD